MGVITNAAAFLAGYNLRLLTVVQAMSQLDAVYGDKEARTFATNHGLQILYAPREQRDADEYSAMLGHFTERATSRGRSRSFSGHGHSTVSRNESEQRRALLLPQEFKELGSERLVVIVENCKPILGEKIRYHRDKVFKARLRPAPAVPLMDMDLHQARVQQRWRYANDDLAPGEGLDLEALAHDVSLLPDAFEGPPDKTADVLLDFFGQGQAGTGDHDDRPEQAMTVSGRICRRSDRSFQEAHQHRNQQHGGQRKPQEDHIPERQRARDAEAGGHQAGSPEQDGGERRGGAEPAAGFSGRRGGGSGGDETAVGGHERTPDARQRRMAGRAAACPCYFCLFWDYSSNF